MAEKKSEELKPWRQRRRSKETDIRKAAVHEFCRHGYGGASIQAIESSVKTLMGALKMIGHVYR